MTSTRSFRTILLALTAGALGAVGCVITVGEVDCSECSATAEPDPLCHSSFNEATNACECDPGYVFESQDPNDFECEREGPKPGTGDCGTDPNTSTNAAGDCICTAGYAWCSNDPDDLTCCATGDTDTNAEGSTVDPSTSGSGETGSGTDAETGIDTDESTTGNGTGPAELPECTAELEGQTACTNNGGVDSVEGSEAFLCQGGEWIPVDMNAECEFAGNNFAYGCYFNDSDEVEYFCGDGPGTDCTNDDDACSTETVLQSCLFGKLTDVDCDAFCTGDKAKVQTDFGTCDAKDLACCCFDEGDEGNCQ
jgi:hypothetical protein